MRRSICNARPSEGETYKTLFIVRTSSPNHDRPVCRIWRGKAGHPYANYRFRDSNHMETWITEQKAAADSSELAKANTKANRIAALAQIPELVKVGTIFHHSWGYDQTNADFYEVISIKNRVAMVREIGSSSVAGNHAAMTGTVVPVPGKFVSEATKKVIQTCGGRPYLAMRCGWCSIWEGRPVGISWYA